MLCVVSCVSLIPGRQPLNRFSYDVIICDMGYSMLVAEDQFYSQACSPCDGTSVCSVVQRCVSEPEPETCVGHYAGEVNVYCVEPCYEYVEGGEAELLCDAGSQDCYIDEEVGAAGTCV